jgi:hypothetical protein
MEIALSLNQDPKVKAIRALLPIGPDQPLAEGTCNPTRPGAIITTQPIG